MYTLINENYRQKVRRKYIMIHKYLTRIEDIEGRDKAFVVIRRLLISSLRLCRNTKVCTKYTALQPGRGRGGRGRWQQGEPLCAGLPGSPLLPSCPQLHPAVPHVLWLRACYVWPFKVEMYLVQYEDIWKDYVWVENLNTHLLMLPSMPLYCQHKISSKVLPRLVLQK